MLHQYARKIQRKSYSTLSSEHQNRTEKKATFLVYLPLASFSCQCEAFAWCLLQPAKVCSVRLPMGTGRTGANAFIINLINQITLNPCKLDRSSAPGELRNFRQLVAAAAGGDVARRECELLMSGCWDSRRDFAPADVAYSLAGLSLAPNERCFTSMNFHLRSRLMGATSFVRFRSWFERESCFLLAPLQLFAIPQTRHAFLIGQWNWNEIVKKTTY